jgi:Icc-related predicted phosphoesterase
MSDLHQEFKSPTFDHYATLTELYDIFIIAGDGSNCSSIIQIENLANAIAPKPLLYVTGNHDYYHSDRGSVDDAFYHLQDCVKNFYFLNHAVVDLGSHVIIGATGWQYFSGFNVNNYPMNDFRLISDHSKSIEHWYRDDRNFLWETLKDYQNEDVKVVVVTHVPPCRAAINLEANEAVDKLQYGMLRAYHNNYGDMIKRFEPDLWLCGHMHDSHDCMVHNTRVVRNAHGYMGGHRLNTDFNEHLIVKV